MTKKAITDIVATIVAELEPLASEERHRVVSASMTLLGETAPTRKVVGGVEEGEDEAETEKFSARGKAWMKQNGISVEQLSQVFHWSEEGVEVIAAEIPGKNNKEKVRAAYILLGIARLLSTGAGSFDDKSARDLCGKLGLYDHTNHMKYMKGGNEFTGSKDKGWVLTTPGLKKGAGLISEIAQ